MNTNITQEEWSKWYDIIYAYYFRRISNRADVEELTAETVGDFMLNTKPVENPKAYIYTIARNKLNKKLRLKYKEQTNAVDSEILENVLMDDMDRSPYYIAKLESLNHCIEKHLKEGDRKIVKMCTMYDFSSIEVSQKMGVNPAAIRKRLSRALSKLKDNCSQVWQEI